MTMTENRCDTAAPVHPARPVEYPMSLQNYFPQNHLDVELMKLGDRFLDVRIQSLAACDRNAANCQRLADLRRKHPAAARDRALDDGLATETGVVASEAEIDRLSAEEDAIVEQIIAAPTRTIEGLCVKAIVLEHVHELYCRGAGEEGFETRMIRSLAMSAMSFIEIPSVLRRQIETVMRASAHPPAQMIAA
jgi:hypothetical protein